MGWRINSPSAILYLSRGLTVLLFAGVAWLSCLAVTRAAGAHAGRMIALSSVTYTGLLLHGHYLTSDIPVAFWMVVVFLFAQAQVKDPRARNYVMAGLFTGVAAATKYNGLAVGLAIPVFHWVAHLGRGPLLKTLFDIRLFVALGMVAVGFVLANPYAVLSHDRFIEDFRYNYITTQVYDGQDAQDTNYGAFGLYLIQIFGPPLAVIVAAGVLASLARLRRADAVERATVAAAAAVCLLYFVKFGGMPRLVPRFALPVAPLLLIAAAPGWASLFKARPKLATPIVWGVAAYGALVGLWIGHRFAADPRTAAQAWAVEHVPPDAMMESTRYSPRFFKLPDYRGQNALAPFISGRRTVLVKALESDPDVAEKVKALESESEIGFFSAATLRERRPDFIAMNSLFYGRFLEPPKSDLYPQMYAYLNGLLREELGYRIVFDQQTPPAPRWVHLSGLRFVDNRMVILKRISDPESPDHDATGGGEGP